MRIYPAIDLMNGRVVRLTKGKFDAVTEYETEPLRVAESFAQAGAQVLHVVDLDGARDGTVRQSELIKSIIESTALRVQLGGGIRTVPQARAYLEAGAQRIVIGSLAVRDRAAAEALLRELGPDRVTLAVDFQRDEQGETRVAIQGWKESGNLSVEDLITAYAGLGIQHVLCTDVSRDGTLVGPDTFLYQNWQHRFPDVEIQVSGGIGSLDHLRQLRAAGARAVILGKSLYQGAFRLQEALLC
jgi:phosphoribosylformimino-5-aminoimidazole carboxamide ribotide isomerase